jgi:hypothetical protein
MIETRLAGAFKRLYERETGETICAVQLATDYGYARYFAGLVVNNIEASSELVALAQRLRLALGRASVIDPNTLRKHSPAK